VVDLPPLLHPERGSPGRGPATLVAARAHVIAARRGDATVEAHRRTMLAHLRDHPDALDRTCPPGHFTGSAMVVDPGSRRFLLMLHAKLGRWFQPGGHADGDGDLPGVAWREATEETGVAGLTVVTPAIDLDVHAVPPPHGPHLHLDVRYLAVAPRGAVPRANHESRGLRWVAYDQLAGYAPDRGLLRLAGAALRALDDLAATGALPRHG
jgi:8-oxo-dGTP pyrophosphatase MutT (NUDIX family)